MSWPGVFQFPTGVGRPPFPGALPNVFACFIAGVQESYVTPTIQALSAGALTGTTRTLGQADPDGGTAAILLTEDGTTGAHKIDLALTNWTTTAGVAGTTTIYATNNGAGTIVIASGASSITVDLATGGTSAATGCTAAVSAFGSPSFWKIVVSWTGATGSTVSVYLVNSGSYAGDSVSGAYLYAPSVSQTGSTAQLVFPNYKAGDPTKGLIQTVDQATFANMPLRDKLSTGARAMRMVGTAPSYMQGTLSTPLAQPFSLSAVVNLDAAAAQYIVGRISASGVLAYANAAGWGMNAGTGLAFGGAYATGTNYLLTWIFNGASSKIYLDGTLQITGNAGTNSMIDVVLGATGAGVTPMSGLLGPVVGYAGEPDTDGMRKTVERLANAWAGGAVALAA